jgi:hypothetical protein
MVPDVSGDGVADLAVGGPGIGAGGAVHVLSAPDYDLWMTMTGYIGSDLGSALAGAGDVDGVGAGELLIGAPGDDELMLVTMNAGAFVPSSARLRLQGTSDALGTAVACCADLDGDGVGELAAGAPSDGYGGVGAGMVYGVSVTDTGIYAPVVVAGTAIWGTTGAQLGAAVAAGADFDGDGNADLLVSAPLDDAGGVGAGAAYLLTTAGLGPADAMATYTVRGADADLGIAASVSLSDLDGDGVGDLVLGAPASDLGGTDAGAVFVFYGPGAGIVDSGDADGLLFGSAGGRVGASVAVGPIDGDPSADLWIAQPGLPGGGAWLVPGP